MNTDKPYFAHSATLRIFSSSELDFDEIQTNIGVPPTYSHRIGDRRSAKSQEFENDMWSLKSGIDKSELLEVHLNILWDILKPNKQYLLDLKSRATVDVFCGYRSDCDHAGIVVAHESLVIFRELEIDFALSMIIA